MGSHDHSGRSKGTGLLGHAHLLRLNSGKPEFLKTSPYFFGFDQRGEASVVHARVLGDRATVKFWVDPIFDGARDRPLPDALVERHGLDPSQDPQGVVQDVVRGSLHGLDEVCLEATKHDFVLLISEVHVAPVTLSDNHLKIVRQFWLLFLCSADASTLPA